MSKFNLGDRVKDITTGRHGVVVKLLQNAIVPGLEQAVVQFEDPSTHEILYFTRLELLASPEPSLDDFLASLEEEPSPEEQDELFAREEASQRAEEASEEISVTVDETAVVETVAAAVKRRPGRPKKATEEKA